MCLDELEENILFNDNGLLFWRFKINGKSCRSDTDVICKVDLTKRSNYPQSPQIFPKIYFANKIWILAVTTGGRLFFYWQRKQSVINVYKNFKLHYFISRVFPQYIKLNFFSPELSQHYNYQRLESHPSPSTVSLSPALSRWGISAGSRFLFSFFRFIFRLTLQTIYHLKWGENCILQWRRILNKIHEIFMIYVLCTLVHWLYTLKL